MNRLRRRRTTNPTEPEPNCPSPCGPRLGEGVESEDDHDPETGPLRRCIVTRERLPKERMIRFVLGPDRELVADLTARLPGRGMWLSARADVLHTACVRGAFSRAARGTVHVPPDLEARLTTGLERRITELLGLARRAGQAVAGFEKAREWLRNGRAELILQASDGSPEERRRLITGVAEVSLAAPLPAAVLGTVFGRERTVHVAIAPGNLARAVSTECEKLAGLSPVRPH